MYKVMIQEKVSKETEDDTTLNMVKKLIKSGKWQMVINPVFIKPGVDLQLYSKLSDQLNVTQEGLVLT